MKFGRHFEREVIPEWRHNYLQYNELKKGIKMIGDEVINTVHFNQEVENQVTRAIEFYEEQRRKVQEELQSVDRRSHLLNCKPPGTVDLSSREALLLEYHAVGEKIISLFHFLQLNTVGLRKILKKFRKHVNTVGPHFLAVVRENKNSKLAMNLKRLKDYSLFEPLVDSVCTSISKLQKDMKQNVDHSHHQAVLMQRGWVILQDLHCIREEMQDKSVFLSFLSNQAIIMFQPKVVRQQSILRSQSHARDLDEIWEVEEEEEDTLSEYINLASTFFYLCGYNIVLPSAGMYAQHLGLHSAVSGVIVAMTPLAALISAVFYSFWSNTSFKKPLVTSSFFLLVGNICYAMAWDFNMTWMILLGRFLCGLGGCRAVNRRYIADTISVENRTRASAAFVAVGAMGMALGPLMASFFEGLDVQVLGITINEMTGPAWLMAVIWIVFAAVVVVFFKEPSHMTDISGRTMVQQNSTSSSMDSLDELREDSDNDLFEDSERDEESDQEFDDSIDIVLSPSVPMKQGSKHSYGTVPLDEDGNRKGKARDRKQTKLTVLCLWIIFWVKLIQEALLTAIPVVTPRFFDWGSARNGRFMAMLGISVVPCNLIIVYFTRLYNVKDVVWLKMLQAILIIGCLGLISFDDIVPINVWRFICGDFVVFATAQVIEGVVMSYFSKIISSKLAAGTCNSGLLATEAGTLGRSFGNMVITFLGTGTKFQLHRNLYMFEGGLSIATLAAIVILVV